MDLDFTATLNGRVVPLRVPLHMSDRLRIEAALRDAAHDTEVPVRCAAIVGMCWPGDGLGVPTLRALRYDLVDYGDHVLDALVARGLFAGDLGDAAIAARAAVIATIPTQAEVDDAAAPFEGPGADYIGTT